MGLCDQDASAVNRRYRAYVVPKVRPLWFGAV